MNISLLLEILQAQGIQYPGVLSAIATTPRHLFVEGQYQAAAYENEPLPIQCNQTISQPYIVARMTELLLDGKKRLNKVLEIGTGSGYQAAILSQVANEVFTIERYETLSKEAKKKFQQLHLKNVHASHGDGYLGWPGQAPFDGIIVTAASPEIPGALQKQLKEGGRMVIPVGVIHQVQQLCVVTRRGDSFEIQQYDPVIFVPLLHGKLPE